MSSGLTPPRSISSCARRRTCPAARAARSFRVDADQATPEILALKNGPARCHEAANMFGGTTPARGGRTARGGKHVRRPDACARRRPPIDGRAARDGERVRRPDARARLAERREAANMSDGPTRWPSRGLKVRERAWIGSGSRSMIRSVGTRIRYIESKPCLICDGSWYVGDEKTRRQHRKRCAPYLAVLDAKPFEPVRPYAGGFYEVSAEVSACPPRWAEIYMQHCTRLLNREHHTGISSDFWHPDCRGHDASMAYISVSSDARMQGAAVVSTIAAEGVPILNWVWIVPAIRNQGIFTKIWSMLSERYGDFKIGGPYSAEMMSYLKRRNVAKERLDPTGVMHPGPVRFVGNQARQGPCQRGANRRAPHASGSSGNHASRTEHPRIARVRRRGA